MSTIVTDGSNVQVIETEGESSLLICYDQQALDVLVTNDTNVIITQSDATVSVIEVDESQVVVTEKEAQFDIITVAEQGPRGSKGDKGDKGDPGPMGTWEDEVPYAKKVDFKNETTIYTGKAQVGSSPDSPVWQISRTDIAIDDDISVTWASGSAAFDKIWSERDSYNYE